MVESNEVKFEWTVENELRLFEAMMGFKPCGLTKHFDMSVIWKRFTAAVGDSNIPVKVIWDHLDTLYDMEALDEMEAMALVPEPFHEHSLAYIEKECGDLLLEREAYLTPKPIKDYTRKDKKMTNNKKTDEKKDKLRKEEDKGRKEKKEDFKKKKGREEEDEGSDTEDGKKARKTPARRSTRGKNSSDGPERDSSPAEVSIIKRILRSRGDDDTSNKSLSPAPTPPPTKRARRV